MPWQVSLVRNMGYIIEIDSVVYPLVVILITSPVLLNLDHYPVPSIRLHR